MLKLIMALLFLVACQGKKVTINNYGAYPDYYSQFDPAVRPFVLEFEADSARFGSPTSAKGIKIQMVDGEITGRGVTKEPAKKEVVAMTYRYSDGRVEIEVENGFWYDEPELRQKAVLYHELGHGLRNLDHTDGKFRAWACGNGLPIMNSSVPGIWLMTQCWETMLADFFKQAPKTALHDDDCEINGDVEVCYVTASNESPLSIFLWGVVTWAFIGGAFFTCFFLVLWLLFDQPSNKLNRRNEGLGSSTGDGDNQNRQDNPVKPDFF